MLPDQRRRRGIGDVDDAKAAVEEHYRTETRYVTPADIRNRCGTEAYGENVTVLMLAEQEAKWCAAAGVTVAQLHQARLMGDKEFIRRADERASKKVVHRG